jgi:glycosyltransferase involved in cell wall biosynthesis
MPTIAFITTCKGRLHHITQTLPRLLTESADEAIVVDYGCPDKVGDWIGTSHPSVTVVRVTDDPGFVTARARNMGAQAAKSEWLIFIDGDVLVEAGWIAWMRENLKQGCFYRAATKNGDRDLETYGTMICSRADYDALGGYDEAFEGWGGDDEDFFRRLSRHGLTELEYPHEFVNAIQHGDDERAGWAGMQSRRQAQTVHECYMAVKAKIELVNGPRQTVPLKLRKKLMTQTAHELSTWFGASAKRPLVLRNVISRDYRGWAPPPIEIDGELAFVLYLRNGRIPLRPDDSGRQPTRPRAAAP